MNKLLIPFFVLLLISCKPQYRIADTNNHIIITDTAKYYIMDSLNVSVQLEYNDFSYEQPKILDENVKRILSMAKVKTNDQILFWDRDCILILKKNKVDLSSFREYSISDSTINKYYQSNNYGESFYRKSGLDKKNKLMWIEDIFPLKDSSYIQMISYLQSELKGGNAAIDPSNLDDILFASDWYKDIVNLSKSNAKSIYTNRVIQPEDPFMLLNRLFLQGKYNNYQAASEGAKYTSNYYTPQNEGMFRQALATYYSFAGKTIQSDSIWNEMARKKPRTVFDKKGTINDLLKEIGQHQIVMFNEAHNVPKHRYLISTLLDEFYNQGFRYLALEAFFEELMLEKYGFPVAENGIYIREPVFANLIREAYAKGFQIVGYDAQTADRETAQAQNIYDRILKKDNNAKILILGGYGHIYKGNMVTKLEEISGIKPYTIAQAYSYLRSLNAYADNEAPEVYIIDKKSIDKKLDSSGIDVFLYNNIEVKNNCFDSERTIPSVSTKYSVPSDLIDIASLCCIYKKNELETVKQNDDIKPIPLKIYDILTMKDFEVELCKGDYTMVYFDNNGSVLLEKEITIE